MTKLPKYMYIEIEDEDEGTVYYGCNEDKDKLEFTQSNRHPIGKYELIEEYK